MTPDSSKNFEKQPSESPAKAALAPAIDGEISQRTPEQEKEFADLWQICEELTRDLAAERKSAAEFKRVSEERQNQGRENEKAHANEIPELERRLRESVAACARATGDLEKERAERRRIEQRAAFLANQLPELHGQLKQQLESESLNQNRTTQLEQQLREREEALARVGADLDKEKEERQLAEQQLSATGDLSAHLRDCLASFEAAKLSFKRTQEQMEAQMQDTLKDSGESGARLQKETTERQRVEEALAAAKRTIQEQATELSKLHSAFQVEQAERQRLQGDAIQARYTSLDSARAGLTAGNRLRRQMREPVENLMKSTRRLLENALEEESKKLVESVLENALLLQTSLQDKESVNAASPATGAAVPPAASNPPADAHAGGEPMLAAA